MTDFSNFELGDNVAELADGLLPEMAAVFEIEISDEPNSQSLDALVGAIGTKKTLRENEAGAKAWLAQVTGSEEAALELASEWLERSRVQRALDRSLWRPEVTTPPEAGIIVTGAVANWQDRVGDLLLDREPTLVWYGVGNRLMSTATEVVNPNVEAFREAEGELPNETQYALEVIVPRLQEAGHYVELYGFETTVGNEIAARLIERTDIASFETLAVARVANAGIQLAVQMREAIRLYNANFDRDSDNPSLFVLTDSFPVAQTLDQAKPENAKEFQSPYTGIRQVALTGKLLVEAAQS